MHQSRARQQGCSRMSGGRRGNLSIAAHLRRPMNSDGPSPRLPCADIDTITVATPASAIDIAQAHLSLLTPPSALVYLALAVFPSRAFHSLPFHCPLLRLVFIFKVITNLDWAVTDKGRSSVSLGTGLEVSIVYKEAYSSYRQIQSVDLWPQESNIYPIQRAIRQTLPTDDIVSHAAKLFSEPYGSWAEGPKKGKFSDTPNWNTVDAAATGMPMRLTANRLRSQYLLEGGECSYTRVTVDGELAGDVFTCRWTCDGRRVCWVTQLVVHKDYRGQGIGSTLLRLSKSDSDDVYGIMSSHPHACVAAAASYGTSIENISLDFIRHHSDAIMKASPIAYVKNASLVGSLFHVEDPTGLISGVNTRFFVDHEEPLDALS
ncbi:hypothetical protein AK830_g4273 [Neonectria ditissima]|uniref:N-acetyltransferase domain-containing protein n=1 Tax=Neonectria ditissima TaxID=78410 RepID=A0A0P7BGG1_9HYPO|nr:hypothetical protein AK830_g4273 [Neonectria ditissima]